MEKLRTARDFTAASARSYFNQTIDGLNGFDHAIVRRYVDWKIKGIDVDPLPDYLLDPNSRAILTSNYPADRLNVVAAVLKVASRLPGEKARIRAIAGKDILERTGSDLRALGIKKLIYPAVKDARKDRYTLADDVRTALESELQKPGTILWQSITGKTEGNGLQISQIQPGIASWSTQFHLPITPMALITENRNDKEEITHVKFGPPIEPPDMSGLTSTTAQFELLTGHTINVMFEIAKLLPPGQRGDFEDVSEWDTRLHQ